MPLSLTPRLVGIRIFTLMLLFARVASATTASPAYYTAGSAPSVSNLSDDLEIHKVVVIHRHGDRSQISRSIGPRFAEEEEITAFWNAKMPTDQSAAKMARAFSTNSKGVDLSVDLFSGEDKNNKPYGMLSEVGVQQLMAVGRQLKSRYSDLLSVISPDYEDAKRDVRIRSTNMCRTLQSLRALLVGLYDITENSEVKSESLLSVHTGPKAEESMIPHMSTCAAIMERSKVVLPMSKYGDSVDGYNNLAAKMRTLLGYEEKVDWLRIKEVMTCHDCHGRQMFSGVDREEYNKVGVIAAWVWSQLYNDDYINKFAIGRFLHDLTQDIVDTERSHKMMIYSGHDSTLVPVLCALQVYDNIWPPYASYLVLEVIKSKRDDRSMYVRAIFNDQELRILNQESVLCPWELFQARMQEMSFTQEDYEAACAAVEVTATGSGETLVLEN